MKCITNRVELEDSRRGIILIVLLAIVSVVGVLVLAVFSLTRHESVASGHGVFSFRVGLAMDAGLEDALARLGWLARDDGYLVFEGRDIGGGEVLMGAEFDYEAGEWVVVELRSGAGGEQRVERLIELEAGLPGGRELVYSHTGVPRSADWVELHGADVDDGGNIEIRYAYVVEDLQARLDPRWVGNLDGEDGLHVLPAAGEAAGLHVPRAGDSLPMLGRVALWVVDGRAGGATPVPGLVDSELIPERDWLPTLESGMKLAGFSDVDMRRDVFSGQFRDPTLASWERNLVVGQRSYEERPLVPVITDGVGLSGGQMFRYPGEVKVNLNRMLEVAAGDADEAVGLFAGKVERHLPWFVAGRTEGVFPEDYLRTLAAGAIDYADLNDEPTVREGYYRGIDAHPLVSEIFYCYQFKRRFVEDGHHYMEFEFQVFYELWNMSNWPAEGGVRISLDFRTPIMVGGRGYWLTDPELITDASVVSPVAEVVGGVAYAPEEEVCLAPNGFGIYATPLYTYRLRGPEAGGPFVIPKELLVPYDSQSNGYRLKWNGGFADTCAGRVLRRVMLLEEGKRVIRGAVPGQAHGVFVLPNFGDVRAAYHILAPVGANAPGNWSPGRPNVRWQLFRADGAEQRMHVRVKPGEWPDGGHDSDFGGYHGQENESYELLPTDELYQGGAVVPDPLAAPMRLAMRGYFLCASELGHVYDPLMYHLAPGDPGNLRALADISALSQPNVHYGGGHTLRIGRPEHRRFVDPRNHAVRLLDLFHTGDPYGGRGGGRSGLTIPIRGHVNINSAGRDVLRALVAGELRQDLLMGEVVRDATPEHGHELKSVVLSAPGFEVEADVVADAIIEHRQRYGPFQSTAQLMEVGGGEDGALVFGNLGMYGYDRWHDRNTPAFRWSDSAAEEVFARIYAASTVRSRNFRITIDVEARSAGSGVLLGRRSRQVHVFIDPGQRDGEGRIVGGRMRPQVSYAREIQNNER